MRVARRVRRGDRGETDAGNIETRARDPTQSGPSRRQDRLHRVDRRGRRIASIWGERIAR